MRCQQRLEAGGVQAVGQRDGVGDGVRREELQRDRDVAEGQVEVDQADLAATAVGQRADDPTRTVAAGADLAVPLAVEQRAA